MKIVVCLKQVPAKDAPLRLTADGGGIREDVGYEMNEPDAYALEEGLRLKEAGGGEVVALTLGPERAAQVLREALAKGADRALHLVAPAGAALDAAATAAALCAALQRDSGGGFDLALTGLQSDDMGYAQTGVLLAERLGLPHATIIMQIEPQPAGGDGARIKAKRELEGGYFQWLDIPLPAVLTIQSGINKLRYATLLGIKQAKNKPLARIPLEELGVDAGANRQRMLRLFIPQKTKQTVMLEGPAAQIAGQLFEHLRTAHLLPNS